jgi:hypothetical protein
MICSFCGEPAVKSRKFEDFCQFHYDCEIHELKIILDSIRDLGQHNRYNVGPTFGTTYYGWMPGQDGVGAYKLEPGHTTLGYHTFLARTPKEAMEQAFRVADRNSWILLRLDVQGGGTRYTGMQSCTDIFVSQLFTKYMPYSDLRPLAYDIARYGALNV